MPKTKISEFSATPANNTDIDSINIAEGCAPSGINDAIRELMAQLKDFQTGAVGDSFNGPINGTVGATTPAAGAFTTLSASSTLGVTGVSTLTGGAVVQGLTVGRGAGAVATNTAVGASALAANTSAVQNTAVGAFSLAANTTGAINTATGYAALNQNTTGGSNSAFGRIALSGNTTGSNNTAVGQECLTSNTTASNNTAVGYQAFYSNTVAAGGVAVGFQAGYSQTNPDRNVAIGYQAMYSNVTGGNSVAIGWKAAYTASDIDQSVAIGASALTANTTGDLNTAIGASALAANTTGVQNTAVGYVAGLANTTGNYNTLIGRAAGLALTTGSSNTFVGGYDPSTGGSGAEITTGSNNSILGAYNGNQGGLDIRTASNYIVLSDGDGNPRGFFDANGKFIIGATASGADRLLVNGPVSFGQASDTNTYINFAGGTNYLGGSGTIRFTVNTGGVQLTSGATSWASASDERLKDIIEPITDAMAKVSSLRTVMGKYKTDAEGTRRPFLIAQDVIAVLPEAVDSVADTRKGDETEYLSVRYTDTIPLLIAAIKELKAEFDAYKSTHP